MIMIRLKKPLTKLGAIIASIFFLSLSQALMAQKPIMRFPDVSESTIVFSCGEDLWTVPIEGGVATKITFNDGQESHPEFSPDGKLIAFTGEYDENSDVFVMNRYGGDIKRVTYHPGRD